MLYVIIHIMYTYIYLIIVISIFKLTKDYLFELRICLTEGLYYTFIFTLHFCINETAQS